MKQFLGSFIFLTALSVGWLQTPETRALAAYTRAETLYLSGGESSNPEYYDPATSRNWNEESVFTGLFTLDPQMRLIPDLVERWDVKNGTMYTFSLRKNAFFHDGKPVTAKDVAYSWERAADPKTDSSTVLTYLGDIVGLQAMHDGEADHISGLRIVDDYTLEVTIDAPKPYFLYKLTYPTAFIVDRQNVESGSDWYRHPNGTGPYKLRQWDSMKQIIYERNEKFYLRLPAIRYIVVQLYTGIPARLYESGSVDIAPLYSYDVPRMTDPANPLSQELTTGVDLCTSYVVLNTNLPPFDDIKVRQAFSMAVDRQQYVDLVSNNTVLPATGLYPPGLPGRRDGLPGLPYHPEEARRLLSESKYASGNFPKVIFSEDGYGSYIRPGVSALIAMWKKNLGISVTVENLAPDRSLDSWPTSKHSNIMAAGWCADYPDPENFADALFHTDSYFNAGSYSNLELDALLKSARTESDLQKRLTLYQQAEDIIIKDAPVVFLSHSMSYVLVKPYIRGYVLTPISIPIERYLSIDVSKLKK
jgi:oligopeptide transport system substrate-binding protein